MVPAEGELHSHMHITPLRSSRALALRFLATKFGLDMTNFTVSPAAPRTRNPLKPAACHQPPACPLCSRLPQQARRLSAPVLVWGPSSCTLWIQGLGRHRDVELSRLAWALAKTSRRGAEPCRPAQVLTVPANVTERGEASTISAHTSDMIELISGVCKVRPPPRSAPASHTPWRGHA